MGEHHFLGFEGISSPKSPQNCHESSVSFKIRFKMNYLLEQGYIVIPNISVNFNIENYLKEQREFVNINVNSTEFTIRCCHALNRPSMEESWKHYSIDSV